MGTVVVNGGQLQCPEGAPAVVVVAGPLRVSQAGVLTQGAETGLSFTGCIKTQANGTTPWACVSTLAATSGQATRLTVNKKPVLLSTAKGAVTTTPPDPTRSWSVSVSGQNPAKPLLTAQ
jgi:hypothetical protein